MKCHSELVMRANTYRRDAAFSVETATDEVRLEVKNLHVD